MANVGPLGRVAMGFALSLGMLGTGVVLERRETYRNYAYGLMGGGWAGVYFTTYAMHALPAALVIESELIGSLSLVLVAAGMIVHSLRYGSQTLTGLAYVSAYAPLAFSPLSTFSLAAAVPLTASLLVVSNRFAWSGVSVLGIASTYAIFILRTSAPDVTGDTTPLYLVLSTYWLLFEIADIAARRRLSVPTADVPLFALNALGFLGSLLLHTRADESQWLLIGAAAAAYSASALVRARFTVGTTDRADDAAATAFSTAHGATALAAALFAHAIDLRFSGTRETVALLVETQLLVAAGVAMVDRHIRRIGTAVAIVTTAHLGAVLFVPLATTGFHSVLAASPTALLVAAAWHFNREWLQRRKLELDQVEYLYSWVALGLVLNVIAREVPGAYRGPMSLVWAGLLLEAGLRRAPEYRHQSYVALAAGSCLTGAAFVANPLVNSRGDQFDRDVWIALPAVIALAYGFGARAGRRATAVGQSMELKIAAAFAVTIGTGFLTVFEWHIVPIDALPAVWAATAAAATAFGVWRGGVVFRWHGYSLAALATLLPLAGLAVDQVDSRQEYVSTIAVIAFLYIVGYIGRTVASAPASLESVVAGFVAFLGSALQALFVWRVVPTDLVAPVWAVSATALVVMGGLRERPWQRWQAYGLVVIATLRTFVMFDVRALDTRLALASAAVVALGYLVGYLGRALRRPATVSDDIEILAAGLLSYGASFHLAALLEELLPRSTEAAAWATAAVALTAVGVWRDRAGQRWQGYAFFWASIIWMLRDLGVPRGPRPADVLDGLFDPCRLRHGSRDPAVASRPGGWGRAPGRRGRASRPAHRGHRCLVGAAHERRRHTPRDARVGTARRGAPRRRLSRARASAAAVRSRVALPVHPEALRLRPPTARGACAHPVVRRARPRPACGVVGLHDVPRTDSKAAVMPGPFVTTSDPTIGTLEPSVRSHSCTDLHTNPVSRAAESGEIGMIAVPRLNRRPSPALHVARRFPG